jgi:hypothetical protein
MKIHLIPEEEMSKKTRRDVLQEKGISIIAKDIGKSIAIISWIEKLNKEGYPVTKSLLEGKTLLQRLIDANSYAAGLPVINKEEYDAIIEFIKDSPLKDIPILKEPPSIYIPVIHEETPEQVATKLDAYTLFLKNFLEKIAIS